MEFEMSHAPTSGAAANAASRNTVAADGAQPSAVSGKRGANAGQGSAAAWGGTNSKDAPPNANISGTSTFAASPQTNAGHAPKRRKNAASNATNGAQPSNGNHAGAGAPSHSGRRANVSHSQSAMIPANGLRESNMMFFRKTGAFLVNGRLESDDGRTVSVNDQVYLVCEPPGDPYYLCRIMEFIHADNDPKKKVEAIRVNWFYRPRDVQRYNNDTRLVYATMHSDICPIASLRGRCQILHRSEIKDLDEYRKQPDSFWYNQCFDRFIHRWYDVIPTSQVTNVPDKVKKALDERWKFICLETTRVKELTSEVKTCKRCVGFCANNDSVECALCHNTYHMNCVRPPLPKKPARGFAWSCGPCSRAQEKKLEAQRGAGNDEGEEEEIFEEEEDDANVETTAPSPNGSDLDLDLHPGTQAEIAMAKMWPMRYLGIHCRVEDALQYDDRAIYPRASSRLGPRHQANVHVWHGRPVELVKPLEIKKKYVKSSSHKKDAKLTKETLAAIEADKAERAKRPKWVMDEPVGYVHRGEDYPNKDPRCTAELQFKMPPLGVHSTRGEDDFPTVTPEQVEAYMTRAKALAKDVGVQPYSTNFLDKCLNLFMKSNYNAEAALKQVKKIDRRKDLKEPELTKEEEKRWNEGAAKYGSEIRNIRLHVKTIDYATAVRYYYMWKKTPKGREIWGSYSNRKGKARKASEATEVKLVDDVADDADDSAFDGDKAALRKRGFQCKFCSTRHSRQWRRAPGVSPGQTVAADGRASKANSTSGFILALCQRCANLWRKYAVTWENIDDIAKKMAQGGGKAWKRRFDEELLKEVYAAAEAGANGTPDYGDMGCATAAPGPEPPKKKQKTNAGVADSGSSTPIPEPVPKKKEKEKPLPQPKAPTPPPVPAQPRLKILPCAVCRQVEGPKLECVACRMTVHRACYGAEESRQPKWFCDTCKNDKKESVSYNYECVLCPQKVTELDLYEPPKISHKKKTDREREKERMEKELVERAKEEYRQKQLEKGRPIYPREPLKRTADNNWVHVHCALWTPETRFTNPARLELVEGAGAPTLRYDVPCKLCKTAKGACVSCLQCHANFHVGCAHLAGYTFGFDVTPVKATRRDAVPTVTINGETGTLTAAIWCKEHTPKTVVHRMSEEVEGTNLTALQLFAREFKQADLHLTGTARKANLVDQSSRAMPQALAMAQGSRRTSAVTGQGSVVKGRQSNAGLPDKQEGPNGVKSTRQCTKCKVDISPRWWKAEPVRANEPKTNGHTSANGHTSPTPRPNGSIDHIMNDAPPVNSEETASQSRSRDNGEVAINGVATYLCQKCHWNKVHGVDDTPEQEKAQPVQSAAPAPEPPQQLPVRSPPAPAHPPLQPAPIAPAWHPHAPHVPPVHQQAPPLAVWNAPPMLHNMGHVMGHPQPYHQPYTLHQPAAYSPYSAPPVHPSIPTVPLQGPGYGYSSPGSAPAPPLHRSNGYPMNGTPPQLPYSHAHAPPRPAESPYPPLQHYSPHNGPPPPLAPLNMPPSPRDTIMRDAAPPAHSAPASALGPTPVPTAAPAQPAGPPPAEPQPAPARGSASASASLQHLIN